MALNFREMPVADKVSLVSVTLLPLVSLAGNAAADIIMVINILVFLVIYRAEFSSFRQSWFLRLSFIFWGWILFCSAVSAFPAHSFQDSLPWIRFPLYAFSLSFMLGRHEGTHIKYFIGAAVLGTFIEIGFMLYEYIFIRGDYARLHGTFGKLVAGWYLEAFSLLAVLWGFEKIKIKSCTKTITVFILLFAAITSYGIIITGEIMSTLFYFGALFLYFLIRKDYSTKTIAPLIIGTTIFVSILLAASFIDPLLQERIIDSMTRRLPWLPSSDYYEPWKMGIETALNNPIFGVGPKNSNLYCVSLQNTGELLTILGINTCPWHPHHLYIQIAAETGLVGLIIFVFIAVYCLALGIRQFVSSSNTGSLVLALVIILFWPIQTYYQSFGQFKNFYFWTVLGCALFMIKSNLKITQGKKIYSPNTYNQS